MTRFVSLYEARTRLPDLVDRAAAGEEIVIARNGMPFAKLVPLPSRGEPQHAADTMNVTPIGNSPGRADRAPVRFLEAGE